MKKITAFILLLCAVSLTVSAQKKLYLSQHPIWVEWADTPISHPVPPEFATQPAIMLLNDVSLDYRYEGKDAQTYYSKHVVIKVLDDNGIARYNTVDVELPLGTKVPTVKARTISPSGKVRNISKDKVQIWMGNTGLYHIVIPMEGVEKNSEIEYVVKEIQSYQNHLFGKQSFQYDIPVAKTRFRLSYRRDMVIDTRSYNGFPELKPELVNNRYQYKVELNDIPALLPEKNSFYNLHTMALEYRVSYWIDENKERIKLNTWNNLARTTFDNNYKLSQKELHAVNNFLTEIGVRANGNEAENIRKIEDGIKKRIVLYPFVEYDLRKEIIAQYARRSMSVYDAAYDDPKDVLDTIIAKKAATQSGYIKLFAACFTQANVRHELGWAWDRTENRFDPNFESWLGLDYALFYFPNQKKFLYPANTRLRYPVIPDVLAGSRGIFCTIPQRGPVTGELYKVRRITPLTEKETHYDITAAITFGKNMDAKADVSHEWYGYQAIDVRSNLPFVRQENMKKYVMGLIGFVSNPANLYNYSFSNDNVSSYYTNKPITLYASANASGLVNKAGNKYLINVGGLIGRQANIYDDKERVMPVDFKYPESFHHTITVNIPKGYKILNPGAAQMSADYLNGELDNVISFNSNYKLVKDSKNGDKLVISVYESYTQLHFPLTEYERFRKVYNTAADFNNVWLVMAKK